MINRTGLACFKKNRFQMWPNYQTIAVITVLTHIPIKPSHGPSGLALQGWVRPFVRRPLSSLLLLPRFQSGLPGQFSPGWFSELDWYSDIVGPKKRQPSNVLEIPEFATIFVFGLYICDTDSYTGSLTHVHNIYVSLCNMHVFRYSHDPPTKIIKRFIIHPWLTLDTQQHKHM